MRVLLVAATTTLLVALFVPVALAGPPLLCWPFQIDGARSIPMGDANWRAVSKDYDTSHLEADTLALLGPGTPVLVRMETLRRAAVYAMEQPAVGSSLLARLQERAAPKGKQAPDALALFDAGYFIEALRQASGWKVNFPVKGLSGYEMVQQAIAQRGGDAEMELAAALMALEGNPTGRDQSREHLHAAIAGAKEGSLLERNIVSHAPLFVGHQEKTLATFQASLRAEK